MNILHSKNHRDFAEKQSIRALKSKLLLIQFYHALLFSSHHLSVALYCLTIHIYHNYTSKSIEHLETSH